MLMLVQIFLVLILFQGFCTPDDQNQNNGDNGDNQNQNGCDQNSQSEEEKKSYDEKYNCNELIDILLCPFKKIRLLGHKIKEGVKSLFSGMTPFQPKENFENMFGKDENKEDSIPHFQPGENLDRMFGDNQNNQGGGGQAPEFQPKENFEKEMGGH